LNCKHDVLKELSDIKDFGIGVWVLIEGPEMCRLVINGKNYGSLPVLGCPVYWHHSLANWDSCPTPA